MYDPVALSDIVSLLRNSSPLIKILEWLTVFTAKLPYSKIDYINDADSSSRGISCVSGARPLSPAGTVRDPLIGVWFLDIKKASSIVELRVIRYGNTMAAWEFDGISSEVISAEKMAKLVQKKIDYHKSS